MSRRRGIGTFRWTSQTGRIGASQWSTLVRTILELILGPLPLMAGRGLSREGGVRVTPAMADPHPKLDGPVELESRTCYLVKGKQTETSYRLFQGFGGRGGPRPCITRNYPRK